MFVFIDDIKGGFRAVDFAAPGPGFALGGWLAFEKMGQGSMVMATAHG